MAQGILRYGTGTADNPYIIEDVADLLLLNDVNGEMSSHYNYYYKLGADISLASTLRQGIKVSLCVLGFNGSDKKIDLGGVATSNCLFRVATYISNITVTGINIIVTGGSTIAGLINSCTKAYMIRAEGKITITRGSGSVSSISTLAKSVTDFEQLISLVDIEVADRAGAEVSMLGSIYNDGTIQNCLIKCTANGYINKFAGLLASTNKATISKCAVEINIETMSEYAILAGLCMYTAADTLIENSYVRGIMRATATGCIQCGIAYSDNYIDVKNSYADVSFNTESDLKYPISNKYDYRWQGELFNCDSFGDCKYIQGVPSGNMKLQDTYKFDSLKRKGIYELDYSVTAEQLASNALKYKPSFSADEFSIAVTKPSEDSRGDRFIWMYINNNWVLYEPGLLRSDVNGIKVIKFSDNYYLLNVDCIEAGYYLLASYSDLYNFYYYKSDTARGEYGVDFGLKIESNGDDTYNAYVSSYKGDTWRVPDTIVPTLNQNQTTIKNVAKGVVIFRVTETFRQIYDNYIVCESNTTNKSDTSILENWDFDNIWALSSAVNDGFPYIKTIDYTWNNTEVPDIKVITTMNIQSEGKIISIPVYEHNTVKGKVMCINSGIAGIEIVDVKLVDTSDSKASPVRVSTPTGILALSY